MGFRVWGFRGLGGFGGFRGLGARVLNLGVMDVEFKL